MTSTSASPASTVLSIPSHEQVVRYQDPATGLLAIVAIYSTALGPSLGGTRFYPYASEQDGLADVLELSRAMAYKASITGLDLGGGKAVIFGDPARDKTPELLAAYGAFVDSLGGRYWTACDVGTYVADMDVVATTCRYVTGRSEGNGGAGDSSVLTALGVYQGMRAGAQRLWGAPTLAGRRVGVSGVGKVGRHLTAHLVADGAQVLVADVNEAAVQALNAEFSQVEVCDPRELPARDLDVYAPCALGHALSEPVVAVLSARLVCGAANNQLARPGLDVELATRGVLYCPDYLVNAGGLIQVADEMHGYDPQRARSRALGIFATTERVLAAAAADGSTPAQAADRLAEQRIAAARR